MRFRISRHVLLYTGEAPRRLRRLWYYRTRWGGCGYGYQTNLPRADRLHDGPCSPLPLRAMRPMRLPDSYG